MARLTLDPVYDAGSKRPKPLSHRENRKLQAAAARAGEIARLEQLFLEDSRWWPQTANVAFRAGQLHTFWWLLTYNPPCPWTFPTIEWVLNVRGVGQFGLPERSRCICSTRHRQKPREERLKLLMHTLEYAAACALQPARLFFDKLVVQMLDALHGDQSCDDGPYSGCATEHGFQMYEETVMQTAAQSGLESVMDWFASCPVVPRWLSPSAMASCALRAGQLSILQLLHSRRSIRLWSKEVGEAACDSDQRHALEWLRAHDYPYTMKCPRYAAARGNFQLLKWMRDQEHPWPWDSSICSAAATQPVILEWLRSQQPPCPWDTQAARKCAAASVRAGDAGWLRRLGLPISDMPELCIEAARQGHLQLLKWLLQQQPPCPASPGICLEALRRENHEMVEYLVEQHDPPIFPLDSSCASGACLLVLAQAGCPMGDERLRRIPQLEQLVESWYTFMGLQQWAAGHISNAGDQMHADAQHAGGHVSNCSTLAAACTDDDDKSSPCSSSCQHDVTAEARCPYQMGASDELLSLLAGLPSELVGKIASYAFLSPKQASKILTAHRPAQHTQALVCQESHSLLAMLSAHYRYLNNSPYYNWFGFVTYSDSPW